MTIGVNTPVSFNTPGIVYGPGVAVVDNSTFALLETGPYKVTFYVYTVVLTLLGTVTLQFSGAATPNPNATPFSLLLAGANLSGEVAFNVTTPGNLQLVQTGLGLTLTTSGTNAAIIIEKLLP